MGLYQAELLQQLSESGLRNFHYGRYYGPCFADDLVLISTYPSTLRKMLDITFKYARKWRYSFNIKETKLLECVKKGSLSDVSPFAGESPVVDEVIHVGVPVSNFGSTSCDQVTERIRKATMTFFAMDW